ncbi:MAG: AAA family ATPase [Paenisporosarcina sp.]
MFFLQMSGFPGAGKSTLAKQISKLTGAVIVDHDVVKSALLKSLNDHSFDHQMAGKISYDIDWSLIDFYLSQGQNTILDSPCFYSEMVEKGVRLSEKHKVEYKYVECYLNDSTLIKSRLANRDRMLSQIENIASEEAFNEWVNKSKKPLEHECLRVDSSMPIENYLEDVLNYLTTKSNL